MLKMKQRENFKFTQNYLGNEGMRRIVYKGAVKPVRMIPELMRLGALRTERCDRKKNGFA